MPCNLCHDQNDTYRITIDKDGFCHCIECDEVVAISIMKHKEILNMMDSVAEDLLSADEETSISWLKAAREAYEKEREKHGDR